MRTLTRRPARRGTVMPMMALAGTSLIAMTALALDLGLLAVSRTNCQSVADAAALTATRTLDNKPGTVNSNQAAATTAANSVVGQNTLATKTGTPNTTTVEYGLYKYYDSTTTPAANPATFDVKQWYPAGSSLPTGEKSWTASRVTVTSNQPGIFSYALGTANLNTYGRAVAVYRPRDIAMTLDMTGSMKYASTVKANESFMSCDPVTPQAGHWNRYTAYLANDPNVSTSSGSTPASRTNPFFTSDPYDSGGYRYSPTNFTARCAGGPAAVKDWYYDPSNLGNPASPVATPNVSSLTNAFHHWDPTSTAPGDPDNYVPESFDYSSWSGSSNATTAGSYAGLYPTPADFGDQTASNLIGDRLPRKRGAEWTSSPGTWDPTATNGAAYTAAEYLGWTNRYAGGTPPTATSNVAGFNPPGATYGRNDGPTLTTKTSLGRASTAADYKTDWSDFRDATWEQYGYDLNVDAYVRNRGTTWDPRKPASGLSTSARQVTPGRFKGYVKGPTPAPHKTGASSSSTTPAPPPTPPSTPTNSTRRGTTSPARARMRASTRQSCATAPGRR
jgi:Flp pilus assembly protein TadG